MQFNRHQTGLGLVEVLVAALILAVGLLAAARFHAELTGESQRNKSRSEALVLAQARLEQMRNYTNEVSNQDDFDALYAATDGFENDTALTGVNAVYTREEEIAIDVGRRRVDVRVGWTGSDGVPQQLVLSTELAYQSPRAGADLAQDEQENLLPNVQGRADLGDGEMPEGAPTELQDDGTELYDAGDGDLRLVLDGHVVLTLREACHAGICTDFTRIHGRVYIDRAKQNVEPGDLFLLASDASFCQRYYEDSSGETHTVTNDTASTIATPTEDYEYFDYNCYVGGGWRGNIGLLLAGGNRQTDKVCLGDPVHALGWNEPVVVARRAYRGMLYKHDATTDSGQAEYTDAEGDIHIEYRSIGVADALVLPDTASAEHHDFVLTSMPAGATEGYNCTTLGVLTRSDSNVNGTLGDRFENNEDDFVCLNDGWLDAYDDSIFGADAECPFDPTDPPSLVHRISGRLTINTESQIWTTFLAHLVSIDTSDGPGNCDMSSWSYDPDSERGTVDYSCHVYDWGTSWTGNVYLTDTFDVLVCPNKTIAFAALDGDSTGNDITCDAWDADHVEDPEAGDEKIATIHGTLTGNGKVLTGVAISDEGSCALAADGLSYSCTTQAFDGTWSASLTFQKSGGAWCTPGMDSTSGIATFLDITDDVEYNLTITKNAQQCDL